MKTIVFCADGTWNGPDDDDNEDGVPDITNVLKLFIHLAGDETPGDWKKNNEQEKIFRDPKGHTVQVAKYIHGVGDSKNPLIKLMGGALGAGLVARIVRGYTYISRNYEPGDSIVLTGFSRGAYTARALGALIASQGLLNAAKLDLNNKDASYKLGAAVWQRYRQLSVEAEAGQAEGQQNPEHIGLAEKLAQVLEDFPLFMSKPPGPENMISVEKIAAIAVWDTVGALGIPKGYSEDERVDALRFIDTTLHPKVQAAFHGVSIDERRADFSPTWWSSAQNIKQVLFAGAHADVGGGYPAQGKNGNECGLSDISLAWMIGELSQIGVLFTQSYPFTFAPDPAGYAHAPWTEYPFAGRHDFLRTLPDHALVHRSVLQRAKAGKLLGHKSIPYPYLAKNLKQYYYDAHDEFLAGLSVVECYDLDDAKWLPA